MCSVELFVLSRSKVGLARKRKHPKFAKLAVTNKITSVGNLCGSLLKVRAPCKLRLESSLSMCNFVFFFQFGDWGQPPSTTPGNTQIARNIDSHRLRVWTHKKLDLAKLACFGDLCGFKSWSFLFLSCFITKIPLDMLASLVLASLSRNISQGGSCDSSRRTELVKSIYII